MSVNANDRIAFEIGRAHLSRVLAEARVEQLDEQLTQAQARIAELEGREDATVEEAGGSGSGSGDRAESDGAPD